jgi:vacuolar-type H+-ATPase subunit H
VEELQSTEALDREILEDARKKAFKIIKNADESADSSKQSWELKLSKALEEAQANCKARAEKSRHEIMARLPMDKRRIRSSKIEVLLTAAMQDFLASLERKRLLNLLERELAGCIDECGGSSGFSGPAELRYRNLSMDELEPLVQKVLPGVSLTCKEDGLYGIPGALPAVVMDFPDVRITASADIAAARLFLDKRAELAAALLGDAALENPVDLDGAVS